MTVAVSIGLLWCLWFGVGEGSLPIDPNRNQTRQYQTVLHRAIVNGLANDLPNGLMISHHTLRTGMGVLLASSKGPTADEVYQAMSDDGVDTISNLNPQYGKFRAEAYVGIYLPSIQVRDDYENLIRDLSVDLVYSYPNGTMKRLEDSLRGVAVELGDLIGPNFKMPKLSHPSSEVFVVMAAAFEGPWEDAKDFSYHNKRTREFNVDERRRTYVDTMYSLAKQRQVADLYTLRAKMLLLPFKNSRVKFMVILPNLVEGLRDLEKELQFVDLRSLLRAKMETSRYDVILPVFNMLTNIELTGKLGTLGIEDIFDQRQADLSPIANTRLYVRRFQHVTKISLGPFGINTYTRDILEGPILRHDPGNEEHFYATHPFFFAILDDHKIYATGRYGNFSDDE